jgi:uncharacterized protein YndB with AHSA1/START domain
MMLPRGRARQSQRSRPTAAKKRNQQVAFVSASRYYAIRRLHNMSDRIEKRIELKAPLSRVWRALTDYREFGEWFRVKLDGPFVPGEVSRGQMTHPGYEHVKWEAVVQKMEAQRLFSFTWPHPKSHEKADYPPDYSKEPSTLVEFRLEKTANGTVLTVTESGFDKLPADRRLEAFRRNEGGWAEQIKNVEAYLAKNS